MSTGHPRLPYLGRKALGRLVRRYGPLQAFREYRWIIEGLDSSQNSAEPARNGYIQQSAQLRRRARGEPLQYVIGNTLFGKLVLQVTPPTLIPRHETEDWALWTADKLKFESLAGRKEAITGLDLCTGTGCIPLLLAAELPPRSFSALAIDVSPSAVDLARRNANLVSPNTRSNSVEFVQADLFSPNIVSFLRSHPLYPFDVITSNPPYLSHREWKALGGSVKSYEDSLALIGEPPPHDTSPSTSFEQPSSLTSPSDPFSIKTSLASVNAKGLAFYDRIAHILHLAPDILKADGLLVVEVGKDQAFDVQAIFERALCSSSCDPDGPVDRGEGISAITSRGHGERQEGRRGTEVRNKKQVPAQFFVRDDYNSIGRTVWGRVPSPQKASSSCISIGDDS